MRSFGVIRRLQVALLVLGVGSPDSVILKFTQWNVSVSRTFIELIKNENNKAVPYGRTKTKTKLGGGVEILVFWI